MQMSQSLLLAGLAICTCESLPAQGAQAPLVAAALRRSEHTSEQQTAMSPQSPLDLRAPPIENVMTQAQIDEVLARTFAPHDIEEVEVGRSRVHDPDSEDYIPEGLASLFWAANHPSGLMRLFMPRQNRPSRAIIDATRQGGPPPAIPAMAGEDRRYDR
jgi:hypothetical protein